MKHPTRNELLEHAGSGIGMAIPGLLAEHLKICPECRREYQNILRLEEVLRGLPVEITSPVFTTRVMNRLGIAERASLWWIFLKNFGPVLAAVVILLIILAAGWITVGTPDQRVGKTIVDYGKIGDVTRNILDGFSGTVAEILRNGFASASKTGSSGLILYIVALLAFFGLADRFIFGPLIRRRR